MSRVGKLIESLEALQDEDIKHSAKVFGIAASLSARLQELLTDAASPPEITGAIPQKITQAALIARFGNFNNAYAAYQKAYGIKCRQSWSIFLDKIQGLKPPDTLEDRVATLEKTVNALVEILLAETDR